MQGLILAAGRGSRLGDYRKDTPKCLLEIGRRPLIEHQLEFISEAGIGPVGMVLGYCADEIREIVGIRAEYIVSSRWQSTNSLYSFALAREWVRGPLVIFNSDILFDPRVLNRVLERGGDAFAFDSTSGDGREHMGVEVVDGYLADMSKELPRERTTGENVGMLCFSEKTVDLLFEAAERLLADGHETDWLGAAVKEVARDVPIAAVDVAGLPWGEIDFPYDLERARKEVWPAIKEENRLHSRHRRKIKLTALFATLSLAGAFAATLLSQPDGDVAWVSMDAERIAGTVISNGAKQSRWTRVDVNEEFVLDVSGPDYVKVDTRLLVLGGESEIPSGAYTIDVMLNGERSVYRSFMAEPSKSWTHEGGVLFKRRSIDVEIPDGAHRFEVGCRSPIAQTECLVRVLQLNETGDEI